MTGPGDPADTRTVNTVTTAELVWHLSTEDAARLAVACLNVLELRHGDEFRVASDMLTLAGVQIRREPVTGWALDVLDEVTDRGDHLEAGRLELTTSPRTSVSVPVLIFANDNQEAGQ